MNKLSVIIITFNEEKNIARCLGSVFGLANEIIVVDSGSSDKTIKIAKKFTDKIYHKEWTNDFAYQKNYAISLSTNEWILAIDADEEISTELTSEISNFLSAEPTIFSGMMIPRKNIIFGKWLKHGECWPDYQLRLFKKDSHYTRCVHEQLIVNGPVGNMINPINHYHYKNINEFIKKTKNYTDLEIVAMKDNKEKKKFWKMIIYPVSKFIKVYFFKQAFRDGWRGFVYSALLGYYSFLKRYKYFFDK